MYKYKPKTLPPMRTGFEVPPNALSDPDRDGVPNFLDCSDRNPNKQGFLGELVREKIAKRIAPKTTEAYEAYKAKAPEREQARIETLKRQAQIEEQRTRITRAKRARTVTRRDTMDYGAFFGLEDGVTPRAAPVTKPKKRRKKKKKR